MIATNGGYYSVVWTTNGPRGPLPAWDKLSLGDKLALATDLSEATARGDVPAATAIAQITELAANHDAYAQYTAVAIAQAIDPFVAGAARNAGRPGSRSGSRRTSSASRTARSKSEFAEHYSISSRPSAGPRRRVRARRPPSRPRSRRSSHRSSRRCASARTTRRSRRLLAELARDPKRDSDEREAAMSDLAELGPPEIPERRPLRPELAPTRGAWSAFAAYFDRAGTRAAAWDAVRGHLGELLAKMSPAQAGGHARRDGAAVHACRARRSPRRIPRAARGQDPRRQAAPRSRAPRDRSAASARRAKAGDVAAAYSRRVRGSLPIAALLVAGCGKHADHATPPRATPYRSRSPRASQAHRRR